MWKRTSFGEVAEIELHGYVDETELMEPLQMGRGISTSSVADVSVWGERIAGLPLVLEHPLAAAPCFRSTSFTCELCAQLDPSSRRRPRSVDLRRHRRLGRERARRPPASPTAACSRSR